MSQFRLAFLALAVWGVIQPMWYCVASMRRTGGSLAAPIDRWYVHAETTGLARALAIAAFALALWVVLGHRARWDCTGPVAIPVVFVIGLASALPLNLVLRGRERA